MEDRFTARLRTAIGDAPAPPPGRPDSRPVPPVRTPLYARLPTVGRRVAAVIVGLLLLGCASWWLDGLRAVAIWVLFSLFVVLWPNWPPRTAGEERAQAWPFEP
jgi:type VI protein secretion system component VasF